MSCVVKLVFSFSFFLSCQFLEVVKYKIMKLVIWIGVLLLLVVFVFCFLRKGLMEDPRALLHRLQQKPTGDKKAQVQGDGQMWPANVDLRQRYTSTTSLP